MTEVYSGAGYSLIAGPDGPVIIGADEVVSVTFTNDYDNSGNGGHGITNHFEYDPENGEWIWVQE